MINIKKLNKCNNNPYNKLTLFKNFKNKQINIKI